MSNDAFDSRAWAHGLRVGVRCYNATTGTCSPACERLQMEARTLRRLTAGARSTPGTAVGGDEALVRAMWVAFGAGHSIDGVDGMSRVLAVVAAWPAPATQGGDPTPARDDFYELSTDGGRTWDRAKTPDDGQITLLPGVLVRRAPAAVPLGGAGRAWPSAREDGAPVTCLRCGAPNMPQADDLWCGMCHESYGGNREWKEDCDAWRAHRATAGTGAGGK